MMNDSTLSGTGLEVLQIVRSSIMLRWMVERHSDLLAVLMQAAERADRDFLQEPMSTFLVVH